MLNPPGKEDLLDLADQGFLVAQEEVAGNLLGDGTGTLTGLAGDSPDSCCAQDADGVDPRVLIEAGIFRCQHGIDHRLWNFIQTQRNATDLAILGDQLAITTIDPHRSCQFDVTQCSNVRQLRLDVEVDTDEAGNTQHSTQHHDNKQANEPFQHGRTTNRLKISQRAQSIALLLSGIRGFPVASHPSTGCERLALRGAITKETPSD